MTVVCEQCSARFEREPGQHRYHHGKHGLRVFCSRRCFGLFHRTDNRTPEEKKAAKSLYDRLYRERNRDVLKAKKRAYHCRMYDPAKAKELRRKLAAQRAEYIRAYNARPENKAAKWAYDKARRADAYGEFGEAWTLLVELQREIIDRCPDKYERLKARGYFERINATKRERRAECNSTRST